MALKRLSIAVARDTLFPRDRCVNTFFLDDDVTSDDEQLIEDAVEMFADNFYGENVEIEGKIYNARDPAPNFPNATYVKNAGLSPAATAPREVALCVSFCGSRNVPRERGRLYLGMAHAGRGVSTGRPGVTDQNAAITIGQGIAGLGGVDVDWVVYSRVNDDTTPVETIWCDDEWDTMRSRGMRATSRVQVSTSS